MLCRRCEMCNDIMEGLTKYKKIKWEIIDKYPNGAWAGEKEDKPEEKNIDICFDCYDKLLKMFS